MQLLQQLWVDEQGAVLSAEIATVATVGVMGTVVGLNAMTDAVNGELNDLSQSFRSLDQSYQVAGHRTCRAWYAGSCYQQRATDETIRDMCGPHRPEHWENRDDKPQLDRRIDDKPQIENRDDKPRSEKRDDDDDKPRKKSEREDDDGQAFESLETPASEKL